MRAALRPLRHPPFGRLFTGYTVNQAGDYVGIVALSVLVYRETGSAIATAGLFIAMQFVPALIAPALTARVDQYALNRSLPALYVGEAALFGALVFFADEFALAPVLVLAFLDGALMLTARSLLRGAVNTVLEPAGLLRQGNGLLNMGFAVASVAGAALGGLLVDLFSVGTALAVDAASFLIIGGLLATTGALRPEQVAREPFRERFRSGLSFAWRQPVVRLLLVGEALAIALFTLTFPIEVIYARETLGADEAGYGLLLASWGAGIVIGSALFLGTRRSLFGLILLSTLAIGVAYTGMGFARELWIACLLAAIGGMGNGVQWVSVMTAVQQATPDDLQARVAGLLESTGSAMMGVGYLAGGILTSLTSPATAFLAAGLGVIALVAAAAALRLLRPRAAPSAVA